MGTTKVQLKELINASKEALSYWVGSFSNDRNITMKSSNKVIKSSAVGNPLEESTKLAKLIHAYVTKLGIVFRPPILDSTYNACYKELDIVLKTLILFVSLTKQISNESELYSKLLTTAILSQCISILEGYFGLISELDLILDYNEINDDESKRLVSVGKIWESCDSLCELCKLGSSGLLKTKLKQTNYLIGDALEEYKEWIENPKSRLQDNPFELDLEINDDDTLASLKQGKTDNEGDEAEIDSEILKFSENWTMKLSLIKLLISSLDKSIPNSKYTIKFSTGVDLLNEKILKLSEYIDDLVASVIYDEDLDVANKVAILLVEEANKIVEIVKKLNNNDEKKCRWLATWKTKFSE